ncbi:arylamine N-acetyltransferase family protein [Sphingopyxis sp.]|uniref:arylamine N-acetyltransferase family protein n=1 Tax=Sphingopyxis sp. TaxID=1908224 RepID=UPI003D14362B
MVSERQATGFDRARYLDRIGAAVPVCADLATLGELTRAHLAHVPFENLDVQLGREPPATVDAIFAKVVEGGRGGWCFELNTLFGRLLADLGYRVTRLKADVRRGGDIADRPGNHLCLRVDLDRSYLVDIGFGGSITAPVEIAEGVGVDGPYAVQLADIGGGCWTFDETVGDGAPFGFDFATEPADEGVLDAMRLALGREDWSPFVQNLVMQLRRGDVHWTLRGRVLTHLTPTGKTTRLLGSADEMAAVGREIFAMELPEVDRLWRRAADRHDQLFGTG